MMGFFIAGSAFGLGAIGVGIRSVIAPTGIEHTILGYSFLFVAAYADALGLLWELIA